MPRRRRRRERRTTLARAAQESLPSFPVAEAQTLGAVQGRDGSTQVNQLLGLVYGLLLLSVIVALLGIVNTLALAVHERTRELGLLRAVGMSKRQVRRMVRAESVITALIGAVLGSSSGSCSRSSSRGRSPTRASCSRSRSAR